MACAAEMDALAALHGGYPLKDPCTAPNDCITHCMHTLKAIKGYKG